MDTKNIYTKYCDGTSLTDKEVLEGEKFFRGLADQLFWAGPAFVISAKEANRTYLGLHGFREARKLKALP